MQTLFIALNCLAMLVWRLLNCFPVKGYINYTKINSTYKWINKFFNIVALLWKHEKISKGHCSYFYWPIKNGCDFFFFANISNLTFCIIISENSAIFLLPSMIIKFVSYSFCISLQPLKEQTMKFFSLAMNMTLASAVQPWTGFDLAFLTENSMSL